MDVKNKSSLEFSFFLDISSLMLKYFVTEIPAYGSLPPQISSVYKPSVRCLIMISFLINPLLEFSEFSGL